MSRPTCRQCVRAGSRCDGYRDQHSLEFRDQTAETLDRSGFLFDNDLPVRSISSNQAVSVSPRLPQKKATAYQSTEPPHDPWMMITLSPEQQGLHFFFYHYLVNGAGQASSHPDCFSTIYARATGHGYLANLAIAVGSASLAYLRNTSRLIQAASQSYSRAIRDIRVSLADPAEAASDQMLVSVMLLALYEVSLLQRRN